MAWGVAWHTAWGSVWDAMWDGCNAGSVDLLEAFQIWRNFIPFFTHSVLLKVEYMENCFYCSWMQANLLLPPSAPSPAPPWAAAAGHISVHRGQ